MKWGGFFGIAAPLEPVSSGGSGAAVSAFFVEHFDAEVTYNELFRVVVDFVGY